MIQRMLAVGTLVGVGKTVRIFDRLTGEPITFGNRMDRTRVEPSTGTLVVPVGFQRWVGSRGNIDRIVGAALRLATVV